MASSRASHTCAAGTTSKVSGRNISCLMYFYRTRRFGKGSRRLALSSSMRKHSNSSSHPLCRLWSLTSWPIFTWFKPVADAIASAVVVFPVPGVPVISTFGLLLEPMDEASRIREKRFLYAHLKQLCDVIIELERIQTAISASSCAGPTCCRSFVHAPRATVRGRRHNPRRRPRVPLPSPAPTTPDPGAPLQASAGPALGEVLALRQGLVRRLEVLLVGLDAVGPALDRPIRHQPDLLGHLRDQPATATGTRQHSARVATLAGRSPARRHLKSCETSTTPPSHSWMASASESMVSMSKWLVGSSWG